MGVNLTIEGSMFVILCEEIRREENGMKSFMGVFPPNGITVKLPTLMPKIAVGAFMDGSQEPVTYTVEFYSPKNEPIVKIPALPPTGKVPTVPHKTHFVLNISPFPLSIEGNYTVKVRRSDGLEGEAVLRVRNQQAEPAKN